MDPHPLANLFKGSNCDEVLYEVIYDRSLNKKHDCNDVIVNSINVSCVNNMQNPKLGDASFTIIMFAIILKVCLEECRLYIPHI